jgi:hypothetical protein
VAEEEIFYADEIPYRPIRRKRCHECKHCSLYDGYCERYDMLLCHDVGRHCDYWEPMSYETALPEM